MIPLAWLGALLAAPGCPGVVDVAGPDALREPVAAALSARGLPPGARCPGWRLTVAAVGGRLRVTGRPPGRPARQAVVSTPDLAAVVVASWVASEAQGGLRSRVLGGAAAGAEGSGASNLPSAADAGVVELGIDHVSRPPHPRDLIGAPLSRGRGRGRETWSTSGRLRVVGAIEPTQGRPPGGAGVSTWTPRPPGTPARSGPGASAQGSAPSGGAVGAARDPGASAQGSAPSGGAVGPAQGRDPGASAQGSAAGDGAASAAQGRDPGASAQGSAPSGGAVGAARGPGASAQGSAPSGGAVGAARDPGASAQGSAPSGDAAATRLRGVGDPQASSPELGASAGAPSDLGRAGVSPPAASGSRDAATPEAATPRPRAGSAGASGEPARSAAALDAAASADPRAGGAGADLPSSAAGPSPIPSRPQNAPARGLAAGQVAALGRAGPGETEPAPVLGAAPTGPPSGGARLDSGDRALGRPAASGEPGAPGSAPRAVVRAAATPPRAPTPPSQPRLRAYARPGLAADETGRGWAGVDGGVELSGSRWALRLLLRGRVALARAPGPGGSATQRQALEALVGGGATLAAGPAVVRVGGGAGLGALRSARAPVEACAPATCPVDAARIDDGFVQWGLHPRLGAWAEASYPLGGGLELGLALDATLDPLSGSPPAPAYAASLPAGEQAALALAAPPRLWLTGALCVSWGAP